MGCAPSECVGMAMKQITLQIPVYDALRQEATTKTVKATAINARWCAYRAARFSGWSLTHRATGYSAGKGLKTVAAVRRLCAALERAYPPKRWTFTDPKAVNGMTKARTIIEKHEAYL